MTREPSSPLSLDLIRSRSADIRTELERLRAYAGLPGATFSGDPEKTRSARYSLIVVAEAAAAICNHLAARHGRIPDSYPECFEILGELYVIEPALAGRLAAMARLRNLLVHGYGRVDDRRLHQILENDLGDVERFLEAIDVYLRRERGEGT